MSKVLTAQAVAKMRVSGNLPREIPDAAAPGLYLIIYPSGKKSWALRFRRPDRRTAKIVLGSVSTINDANRDPNPVIGGHLTLAGARRLVGALKHNIAMGKDPAADHQAEKRNIALSAADTFAAAANDFVLQHAKKNTRLWQKQARLLGLREVNEDLELIHKGLAERWRNKPLSEIDPDTMFRLHRRGPPQGCARSGAYQPKGIRAAGAGRIRSPIKDVQLACGEAARQRQPAGRAETPCHLQAPRSGINRRGGGCVLAGDR